MIVADEQSWQWKVTRPDGSGQSSSTFKTLKECADDARLNGWGVWGGDERRRVELGADALRLVPEQQAQQKN